MILLRCYHLTQSLENCWCSIQFLNEQMRKEQILKIHDLSK